MKLIDHLHAFALVLVVAACSDAMSGSSAPVEPGRDSRASAKAPAETQAAPANPMGAATKAFIDRINEYVSFHNNVEKMVPALTETKDPQKIADREKALGAALIKSRPDAKMGDFFIKQYQPYLLQIVKEDFAKRSVADRKALVQELPKGTTVSVNAVYPTTLPLITFPPNLLKKLPELPPELEYRIVGRDLVLRDVKGNVVVDIMRNVFPIPS